MRLNNAINCKSVEPNQITTDKNIKGKVPPKPSIRGAKGVLNKLKNDKYLNINYLLFYEFFEFYIH